MCAVELEIGFVPLSVQPEKPSSKPPLATALLPGALTISVTFAVWVALVPVPVIVSV